MQPMRNWQNGDDHLDQRLERPREAADGLQIVSKCRGSSCSEAFPPVGFIELFVIVGKPGQTKRDGVPMLPHEDLPVVPVLYCREIFIWWMRPILPQS